ncbi:hypothetical protein NEPAR06_0305 [Nematocida parisii]|uniref:Uncharacterized protein n=1 Tax=Nematocida parisii (strain ERTm3) TaxID=935791 RepID=I3EIV8_NEMP3|nr:uncharacterized protein NEPG_01636 [Nematocida parisii ERTm1]EIJ89155.1 hypothetical protein NEQG_00974 [Nematocida parisii ERTm3]KAI5126360.1 hypothetical protein NEPAR03_0441 [Nematocida parisii]EIJ93294.1 hypothetical protein NEPG_01636 [Nematocida parisii ERTm1]KAI5126439.1 hypothetical protein NEPAR08_0430 [Nematocida parisii]KAI5140736.1 hypothetical protein NEPAR04_0471 [Nematocida parisii]|eukprot:XP_013059464.1 hypothetical protein NEPG_01636 [Nematocida parisii ERTm1]
MKGAAQKTKASYSLQIKRILLFIELLWLVLFKQQCLYLNKETNVDCYGRQWLFPGIMAYCSGDVASSANPSKEEKSKIKSKYRTLKSIVRDYTITLIDNTKQQAPMHTSAADFMENKTWIDNVPYIEQNRNSIYTLCINGNHTEIEYYAKNLMLWIDSIGVRFDKLQFNSSKMPKVPSVMLKHFSLKWIEFKDCEIGTATLEAFNYAPNVRDVLVIGTSKIVKSNDGIDSTKKKILYLQSLKFKHLLRDNTLITDVFGLFTFENLKSVSFDGTYLSSFDFLHGINKSSLTELNINDEIIEKININLIYKFKNLAKMVIQTDKQEHYNIDRINSNNTLDKLCNIELHYSIYRHLKKETIGLSAPKIKSCVRIGFPTYHGTSNYAIVKSEYDPEQSTINTWVPCEIYRTSSFSDFKYPYTDVKANMFNIFLVSCENEGTKYYIKAMYDLIFQYRKAMCEYVMIHIYNRGKSQFNERSFFSFLGSIETESKRFFIVQEGEKRSLENLNNISVYKCALDEKKKGNSAIIIMRNPITYKDPERICDQLGIIEQIVSNPSYKQKYIYSLIGKNQPPDIQIDITKYYNDNKVYYKKLFSKLKSKL